MKLVPLRPVHIGLVAMVDDKDFDLVKPYTWRAVADGNTHYALGTVPEKGKTSMHRFIMNGRKGVLIDHKDGNGLNNQRINLRPANHHQNAANRHISGKLKGVRWSESRQMWKATIVCKGKRHDLGCFIDPAEAAAAYDQAAMRLFGRFACTNESMGTTARIIKSPRHLKILCSNPVLLDGDDWPKCQGITWLTRRTKAGPLIYHRVEKWSVPMTCHILDVGRESKVVHINGDTLDMRRENLALVRAEPKRDVDKREKWNQMMTTQRMTSHCKPVLWL